MKGQDILLLLKLVSISKRDRTGDDYLNSPWQDWETELISRSPESTEEAIELGADLHLRAIATHEHSSAAQYGVRALAEMTGISKSQVSLSLTRCYANGLAYINRISAIPTVNTVALGEFIIYGLKYVFPAYPGALTRGIATAWAAPVLSNSIISGGDIPLVWPDPRGNTKGQAVEPIYPTVPAAVRKDPMLYSFLALIDSIRIGRAREKAIACDLLVKALERKHV